MRLVIVAACASLGFATAAVAKDPPEDKIICKRQQDADTGSHFASSKKVCLKKSEWKEREDQAERTMERIRSGGAAGPLQATSGGGPG
ncbi:MAG TPA: hypothetical protein VF079_02800 [Sphingomicrobium sp.]